MEYKTIKSNFSKKGFDYSLIKRENDKAIYKQSRGNVTAYEVILIRRHNGYNLGDVYIEPSETYPSDNEWGVFGFTCTTLEQAETRFKKL